MIDKSKSLEGTHSGALDGLLSDHKREQLNRLSTEIRLIRKGFDVTDYLNEVNIALSYNAQSQVAIESYFTERRG